MKYTQIPTDTFKELQMNAGILTASFVPSTGVVTDIIGATSGGITITDNVSYTDFGDDIDNCPKNTMELKRLDSHEVTISGTFVTVSAELAAKLAGAADVASEKVTPRNDLKQTDFSDLWFVGDYSDVNSDVATGDSAGYVAVHLMNALNTGGFQLTTSDRAKGQFAFTFTGHYSMANQDVVPYEIYVKAGVKGT